MTLRAYIDTHFFLLIGRLGFKAVTTAAYDLNRMIIWMDSSFHLSVLKLLLREKDGRSYALEGITASPDLTLFRFWANSK